MSDEAELKATSFELEEATYEVHMYDVHFEKRPVGKNQDLYWFDLKVDALISELKPDRAKMKFGFGMKENEGDDQ